MNDSQCIYLLYIGEWFHHIIDISKEYNFIFINLLNK
jgi:hypothetical protein